MIARKKTQRAVASSNITSTPSIQKIPPIDASENIVTLCTIQVQTIKTLFTALKEIMTESSLVFRNDGLRITNLDKSKKILVHLSISPQNLEFYECNRENVIVGVDMKVFHNTVSCIDNTDILTIYIDKKDYKEGVIETLTFRSDKGGGQYKIQCMRVIEHDHKEVIYPNVEFRSVITMPSIQFQKIVKDAISSKYLRLEIEILGGNKNEIIFKSINKDAYSEIHMTQQTEIGFLQTTGTEEKVTGMFCCKTLLNFTKCSALSQTMEIRLDNELPLVVKYLISNLGYINLCLSPIPKL